MYLSPQERSKKGFILTVCFLVILMIASFLVWEHKDAPYLSKFLGTKSPRSTSTAQFVTKATFVCNNNQTIIASFFNPASSSPETLGSVSLILSDGRSKILTKIMSASGAKYSNADDSFVFWNKGNTAFIEEGSAQTETYTNCTTASGISGVENWNTFASSTMHLSVRYPTDYTLQRTYTYTLNGPDGPAIQGVKMIIPPTLYQGTNLSGYDTGVSIEQLPAATSTCSALAFLPQVGLVEKSVKDLGVSYLTASLSGAGAGNRYDETVYTLKSAPVCTAVRYFIHSTNIGNYTEGSVKEYDKKTLLAQFDKIRESVVLER